MTKRSIVVSLMGKIPTMERNEVRNTYLTGRAAALQGDTETRDQRMHDLAQWAKMNGVVAGIAFVAAGINAYASLRTGSPNYNIAAGFNATVGVLQTCSVYAQSFLRQNLANTAPDPSFDPTTQPELREFTSLREKAVTYLGFAAVGITAGAGLNALTDL